MNDRFLWGVYVYLNRMRDDSISVCVISFDVTSVCGHFRFPCEKNERESGG